jgi:hypothetical protein
MFKKYNNDKQYKSATPVKLSKAQMLVTKYKFYVNHPPR